MLRPGNATKVTIHLNEDTASEKDFLHREIFAFLFSKGVAGATMMRPESGFGSHHRVHTAHSGHGSDDHLPIKIQFIESDRKVSELMPELCELVSDGLIEAHPTTIYKSASEQESL